MIIFGKGSKSTLSHYLSLSHGVCFLRFILSWYLFPLSSLSVIGVEARALAHAVPMCCRLVVVGGVRECVLN